MKLSTLHLSEAGVLRARKIGRFDRLLHWLTSGLLIWSLGLGALYAISFNWQRSINMLIGWRGTCAVLLGWVLALAVAFFALRLARRKEAVSRLWFLLALIGISLLVRASLVLLLVSPWTSDFQSMWRAAGEMLLTRDFHAYSPIHQRALPILVPTAWLFHGWQPGVIAVNLGLVGVLLLAVYDLLRIVRGERAAQVTTLLLAAAPEPLISVTLPSHDFYGLVFFVLFAWALVRAIRTNAIAYAGAWTFASASFLVLIDMQRNTGPIVLILLALLSLLALPAAWGAKGIRTRGNARRLLACIFGITVLFSAGTNLLGRAGLLWGSIDPPVNYHSVALDNVPYHYFVGKQSTHANMMNGIATHGTSMSSGDWTWMQTFQRNFLEREGDQWDTDLAFTLIRSDFALQPLKRIENIEARAKRLFSLNRQLYFYYTQPPEGTFNTGAIVLAYSAAYTVIIGWLTVLGLFFLFPRRLDASLGPILLYPVFIALSLLILFESQERYVLPVWLSFAVVIGVASWRKPRRIAPLHVVSTYILGLLVPTLFALAVVVGWATLTHIYQENSGRVLADWQVRAGSHEVALQRLGSHAALPRYQNSWFPGFGKLAFDLQLQSQSTPEQTVTATTQVCANSDRTGFAFYFYTPYRKQQDKPGLELQVWSDGKLRRQIALPESPRTELVRIADAIPANRCGAIELRLISHSPSGDASRKKTAKVEIYFPHMVR